MNATVDKAILPAALRRDQVVGLAPLAGPHRQEDFQQGLAILRDLGFAGKTLQPKLSLPFLAGSDQERLEILHSLWRDPQVGAVMAIRGGYGTLRLLEHLDYDLLRQSPKMLIGFSDISGLLNVITARTGLVTLHGPNLTTLHQSDKQSLEAMVQCLRQPLPPSQRPAGLEVIRSGRAAGVLAGGNLTTLTHLLGTPFQLTWAGKILFLEDVGEAPYRIDRLLTQLALAGGLDNIAGLILGSFTHCGDPETIWQRVDELTAGADIPIWGNFPVGHGPANVALPIGSQVIMDSDKATLSWSGPWHTS